MRAISRRVPPAAALSPLPGAVPAAAVRTRVFPALFLASRSVPLVLLRSVNGVMCVDVLFCLFLSFSVHFSASLPLHASPPFFYLSFSRSLLCPRVVL